MKVRVSPIRLMFLALAMTSTAAAQQACQPVVEQFRAYDPPSWDGTPGRPPVLALDGLPKGILHVSPGKTLTSKEVIDVLREDFRASQDILDRITRLSGIPASRFALHRLGTGALHAVEMNNEGHQLFVPFVVAPDGRATPPEPAVAAAWDTLWLHCLGPGTVARVGDVGGVPAFICQRGIDQDQEIEISLWQGGAWQQSCALGLHFQAEFKISEQFCNGVNCARASEQALARIKQFDRQPFAQDPTDRTVRNSGKFRRLEDLALEQDPSVQNEPPYLNAPVTNAPVTFGSQDSFLQPFVLDGETYVTRLGHAYSFSRGRSLDYLFAIYRLSGDQLEPAAGFYVTKTLTPPTEVTLK